MANDVAGSIRKLTLDGIPFDVNADANISEVGSKFENSILPTSGRGMRKMMKRTEDREGVVVACNGDERDILRELADRPTDFPLSYETAAGDVYRTTGFIEFENRETEENKASLKLFPRKEWQPFIA